MQRGGIKKHIGKVILTKYSNNVHNTIISCLPNRAWKLKYFVLFWSILLSRLHSIMNNCVLYSIHCMIVNSLCNRSAQWYMSLPSIVQYEYQITTIFHCIRIFYIIIMVMINLDKHLSYVRLSLSLISLRVVQFEEKNSETGLWFVMYMGTFKCVSFMYVWMDHSIVRICFYVHSRWMCHSNFVIVWRCTGYRVCV